MPVIKKISDATEWLTADEANTDVPPGVDVPDQEDGAVERPDREPQVGFEPDGKS